MSLSPGTPAPDFTLKNQHGESITLSSFRGRPVVLVFFPFAFSGICTGELCEFRDNLEVLAKAAGSDVTVLAVSCDHFFSNRAYSDREGYEFDLLSDFWPHGEVARAYGVFSEGAGAALRGSFVIDADGVVAWSVVHPIGQAREFAAYRAALITLG